MVEYAKIETFKQNSCCDLLCILLKLSKQREWLGELWNNWLGELDEMSCGMFDFDELGAVIIDVRVG